MVRSLNVLRYSAANAIADMRMLYTWKTWTFGWLGRMLAQVTFFTYLGRVLGGPGQVEYMVIGNAVMVAAIEAMIVVASSSWERDAGTLALLLSAPADLTLVFLGRSVQWLFSGVLTSLVSIFVLAPAFGVRWHANQILPILGLVPLTAVTTYCFGLFVSALVLNASSLRNIVSNGLTAIMMSICGVEMSLSFWPRPVQAVAHTLPLTYAVEAMRRVAASAAWQSVLPQVGAALLAGVAWLGAAFLAFRLLGLRGRRAGTVDFAS